jgi:hypothetical protein
MQVKEAVSAAKTYVADLFSDEHVKNIGLEEVEFDEGAGVWNITVGFSRPWDDENPITAQFRFSQQMKRDYKIVRISDGEQKVLSIKSRVIDE